ncbi:MAG: hypothetical protein IJN15_03190, partial [Clostridia bacterium]|nr:hypothetical protein [Clostridia bacterium]
HGDCEYIKDLLYNRKSLQMHYEFLEELKEPKTLEGVGVPTSWANEAIGYKLEGGKSGMDNTPRGKITEKALKERPNNPDMLWVDAICQQALSARSISALFFIVGDEENGAKWQEKYNQKKHLINELYWDKKDKFYYDIDFNTKDFYKVMTIASYWALTAKIADSNQAAAMAELILDDNKFGGSMPLPSLARDDGDFDPCGRYWRGGVWLPTAYATLKGLTGYGIFDIAHKTARKILDGMLKTYSEFSPHTIWECYSPCEFMPATDHKGAEFGREDFCGWSALGPISIYIEYVLGFHTVNAFDRVVEWEKPRDFQKKIGIKNLRFGEIVTDIVADGDICSVKSNGNYTLKICGKTYEIKEGINKLNI